MPETPAPTPAPTPEPDNKKPQEVKVSVDVNVKQKGGFGGLLLKLGIVGVVVAAIAGFFGAGDKGKLDKHDLEKAREAEVVKQQQAVGENAFARLNEAEKEFELKKSSTTLLEAKGHIQGVGITALAWDAKGNVLAAVGRYHVEFKEDGGRDRADANHTVLVVDPSLGNVAAKLTASPGGLDMQLEHTPAGITTRAVAVSESVEIHGGRVKLTGDSIPTRLFVHDSDVAFNPSGLSAATRHKDNKTITMIAGGSLQLDLPGNSAQGLLPEPKASLTPDGDLLKETKKLALALPDGRGGFDVARPIVVVLGADDAKLGLGDSSRNVAQRAFAGTFPTKEILTFQADINKAATEKGEKPPIDPDVRAQLFRNAAGLERGGR